MSASENTAQEYYDDSKLLMKGHKLSRKEVSQITKQLQKNPDNIRARLLLLGFYESPRRMDKYYELLNWIIDNQPRRAMLQHVGVSVTKTEAYRLSKRHWLRQLRLNPDDITILCNIANFCQICDQKDSVKYLRRAVELQPNSEELVRQLAHAYKLMLSDHSRAIPRRAVDQMIRAVELYEQRTDEHSYLLQYFDFEVRDFATIALRFGLLSEARRLGNSLLNRRDLDSTRLGLSVAAPRRSYFRSTAFGLSTLGLVALAENDTEAAGQYLMKMCEIPVSQFTDFHLANELLKKKQEEIVLCFLAHMIKGWKQFLVKFDADSFAPADCLLFDRSEAVRKIAEMERWVHKIEKGKTPNLHPFDYY